VSGGDDVNRLERRARRLLRAYPPEYRASRGEEITGTLLEATPPDRNWPPARDTVSVIVAGLRARRDANLRQGLPVSLRQAAVLGIAMFLVQIPCDLLGTVVDEAVSGRGFGLPPDYAWELLPAAVLVTVILAAAWYGRRSLVAVPAVAAATAAVVYYLAGRSPSQGNVVLILAWPVVSALAVLMPLTSRTARPPRSLLWLVCLPLGLTLLDGLAYAVPFHIDYALPVRPVGPAVLLFPFTTYLSLVTVAVAVCWLVTDVRPLAGLVLMFLLYRAVYAFQYNGFYPASPAELAVAIAVPLALACVLVWLFRRRTRSSPPAAT
jgi:uncharacterized protein (TIGR03382 family)